MFQHSKNRFFALSAVLCLLFPFCGSASTVFSADVSEKITTAPFTANLPADNVPQEQLTFPDSVALAAPDAAGRSIPALVTYLKQHLGTQEQLARAIYTWITRNISYNVYVTFTSRNEDLDEAKEIQKVLTERKGICQEYALLFKAMAKEAGMNAYIVDGYNRRDGALLPDPHQWCAACIDGRWYMFDPTWGAGFVENYKFVPSPNHRFCKVLPDSLLKTHMPFDPLFQFRERPVTYDEFDSGTYDESRQVPVFYWADTLALYARQDTLERLMGTRHRILANGQTNDLVYYTLELTSNNIRVVGYRKILNAYNMAMDLQGKATDAINHFVRYRNKGFQPLKPDDEIQAMVDVPEKLINRADSAINSIHTAPDRYREPILELRDRIMEIATTVYKHKLFLRQYFKLPEKQRKGLFSGTK